MSGVGFCPSRHSLRGQLKLLTTGSSGGLVIGGDVALYRGAANILYTPDYIRLLEAARLELRDPALYLSSKNDGHLDVDADTQIDFNTGLAVGQQDAPMNISFGNIKRCKVDEATRTTPQEGDLKWNATTHKLQVYSGSAWETVTSAE